METLSEEMKNVIDVEAAAVTEVFGESKVVEKEGTEGSYAGRGEVGIDEKREDYGMWW